MLDGQGQLAAERDYDAQTQNWSIGVTSQGGDPSPAASGHAPVDLPLILGFGPTTDSVLVESIDDGHRVWRLLSIKDRTFSPMPTADVFDTPLSERSPVE